MEVYFDKKAHSYMDGEGNTYPSVSQVFSGLGLNDGVKDIPNIEFYAQRGTMAHYALELYAAGIDDETFEMMVETELLENPLVKWKQVEPYFESGKKFIDKLLKKNKITATERQFISEDGYAGTADLTVELPDNTLAVCDYKTGKTIQPTYEIQISAYALAVCANAGYVVKLKEDGSEAEMVKMDIVEGTKKWLKLLDIYKSDLSDEEKRMLASQMMSNKETITDAGAGEKLIETKIMIDLKKEELKELEKEFADVREQLGVSSSSVFSNDMYELKLTLVEGKEEKKVNHEKLAEILGSKLTELKLGDWVAKQIADCFETKITNPSWRTYLAEIKEKPEKPTEKKKPEKPAEKKKPAEKPEKPAEKKKPAETVREVEEMNRLGDIDEPVNRSPVEYDNDPDTIKTGRPASTKSPVTDKVFRSLDEEKVEAILKERGLAKYSKIFWVTVENAFGVSIREGKGEISMDEVSDLAEVIEESALKKNAEKFKNGELL